MLMVWKALGSLKLTVVLLSLLVLLVFAGTLAQAHHDVWYVMKEGYFRVWIAKIDLQIFPTLAGVFAPSLGYVFEEPYYFPFPGGYAIGFAMAINLLAAHTLRYKVMARGSRLMWGLGLLAVGSVVTWLVIARATSSAHQASISPEFAQLLWNVCRGVFAAVTLVTAYLLTLAYGRLRRPEWFVLAGLNVLALAAAAFLFFDPNWRIPDAGMRIVWQLAQATTAGGLLMASLWLLFNKRSGVIFLHIGIAILMAHEFYVAETNVEANMMIAEGETVDWVFDPRAAELALIDSSDDEVDRVTVIPAQLLATAAKAAEDSPERVISHADLPVDVRVLDYFANCAVLPRQSSGSGEPWQGLGRELSLKELETGSEMDIPGAHVELLDKQSGESLGRYVVTNFFDDYLHQRLGPRLQAQFRMARKTYPLTTGPQTVAADKPVTVGLRYARTYKPYEVTLEKFTYKRYAGSSKAKDFASDVQLVDKQGRADIKYHIYMNNPLRYEGETFYQSEFDPWTETGTVLQVVKNEGWMAPYIGCAVVVVGMLVHFGITLVRFLNRRLRELGDMQQEKFTSFNDWALRPEVLAPTIVALLVLVGFARIFRTEPLVVNQMSIDQFAQLPVLDEGRVKPYDTVARNTLQYFAQRQEAPISEDGRQKIPASQWLLDLLSGKKEADGAYVFRVTNLELLQTLGLPTRKGFRYSWNEIDKNVEKLHKEVMATTEIEEKELSRYQRDLRKLWSQRMAYSELANSFKTPQIRLSDSLLVDAFLAAEQADRLDGIRSIPPREVDAEWYTLFEADLREHCYIIQNGLAPDDLQARIAGTMHGALSSASNGQPVDPAELRNLTLRVSRQIDRYGEVQPGEAIEPLAAMLAAYRNGDPEAYSAAMNEMKLIAYEHERQLNDPENAAFVSTLKTVEKLNTDRLQFERWFNAASPFFYCAIMYLIALLLSAASWLVWPKTLGRSAIAIIAVTLVVHTLAIAARVYISGRPPITNLYTTAICIGWAVVLLMLVFESIFKLGIGGFVASACGFATLLIAHFLGSDGDTFTVMQAVLDTQFWLTVHVLSINFGYAATMLAGCLGIAYIVAVHMLELFNHKEARQLTSMIYGSLCFAILFSFVGTVLGGLWADDSWGRFWGWDPKENGALMIVLWNAVALHARWGKMVGSRGLAMLTVVGNIITAWSWFGVNQLSIGLHAYGFDERLARGLLLFIVSQILVLIIGAIPWPKIRGPERGMART